MVLSQTASFPRELAHSAQAPLTPQQKGAKGRSKERVAEYTTLSRYQMSHDFRGWEMPGESESSQSLDSG